MKHASNVRRKAAALLLAVTLLAALGARAESGAKPAEVSATVAELLQVPDFKFFVREDGIGSGTCPVYTAPSEESIRLADGRAACDVSDEIAAAGYVNGEWLLIRYEIKEKKVRVGYIPPKYTRSLKADVSRIRFSEVPAELAEETEITDNPRLNSTPFGTLPAGAEITVLAKYTYTGNWWYVEAELDGKLTRGFIDRSAAALTVDGTVYRGNEALGYPAVSPENTKQIGVMTVNGDGDNAMIVRRRPDRGTPMVARVYGGESFPCYAQETGTNGKIWYLIWVDGVWGWFSSASSTLAEGD